MRYDPAWQARISGVLSGALRIWGVRGTVTCDPDDTAAFVLVPDAAAALRVRHDASTGWTLTLCIPGSRAPTPRGCHAGLPGLLRQLREELAPDSPAGRLIIGVQPLLRRDADGR